ncbi:MAG: hypothetical protein A2174_03575 [Candidatus Portnoybacteria bacterium RBG_13_41_18]|uniref:Colicin V production protein n=1 Tax=Candidatus Portnoybacteria bacterium RBG_13_41_18 TaxID=1801991 RepID=A0A1G2F8D0_9BACT|nr:MAG: hypothetical protein A2174_03575 [Candidatus Portnoybacteria bacterium RBG_13_41_18]
MSFFSDIAGTINLGANWLLILIFLVVGGGAGLVLGGNRVGLITLATYFSYIFNKAIPWRVFLSEKNVPAPNVQTFLFLAVILVIFFLAPRSGLNSFVRVSGRGRANWLQLAILGVLELGFLISAVISFLPANTTADLSLVFKRFFVDDLTRFLWIILPLVAMMILKKRRSYGYGEE